MYVVFDLETTGFDSNNCDVIEFSYIAFDEYTNIPVKAETLYFYYPGMSWSEEAYAVHKISRDFLREHQDKFRDNLIKMFTVLNLNKVCGHNAEKFDCVFATNWLIRMGLPRVEFIQIEDTMTMFKSITKTSRISLQKLRVRLGIDEDIVNTMRDIWYHPGEATEAMEAHNAEWDVTATALILMKGINNGFCSFKPRDPGEKLPDIDFDSLDFSDVTDMFASSDTVFIDVLNGNSYAVNLKMNEMQSVSVDDKVYLDARVAGRVFPEKFVPSKTISNIIESSDTNTFVCELPSSKWVFIRDEKNPAFYIESGGMFTKAPEVFNFQAYIEKTFG